MRSNQTKTKTKPAPLGLTPVAALLKSAPPPAWLVDGVMIENQPMVIGGPAKSLKTSVALDLAVSLGTGTPFLGRFPVPRRVRVAVFCGEFAPRTIAETVQRIATAKKTLPKNCRVSVGFDLPTLGHAAGRADLGKVLAGDGIEVVVIDPLFHCLFAGSPASSAANLYDVGAVLAATTACCLAAGATPVFVHHTTKRSAPVAASLALAELAFAGIGEFVRQWVLLTRRAEFRPGTGAHDLAMTVGGSAGHSSRWRVGITEGQVGNRGWAVAVEAVEADATVGPPQRSKRSVTDSTCNRSRGPNAWLRPVRFRPLVGRDARRSGAWPEFGFLARAVTRCNRVGQLFRFRRFAARVPMSPAYAGTIPGMVAGPVGSPRPPEHAPGARISHVGSTTLGSGCVPSRTKPTPTAAVKCLGSAPSRRGRVNGPKVTPRGAPTVPVRSRIAPA